MAKQADKIIVVLSKSELKELPAYVRHSKKTIYWNGKFNGMPMPIYKSFPPFSYNYHAKMLERIMKNVDVLVKEID